MIFSMCHHVISCLLVVFPMATLAGVLPATVNLLDMSYRFKENETLYYPLPTFKKFTIDRHQDYLLDDVDYFFKAREFSAVEHGGTHMDAPIHFWEGKLTMDEIPVKNFVGEGVVIDFRKESEANSLALLTTEHIMEWEKQNGCIPDDAIVLLYTGWGKYYPNGNTYFGGPEGKEVALTALKFPGLHPDAAKWLVKNRKIAGIGTDTASIDSGDSTTYGAHTVLSEANIFILEMVANVDKLPGPTGFTLFVLPWKIHEGTGAPTRIVAMMGDMSTSAANLSGPSLITYFCILLSLVMRL